MRIWHLMLVVLVYALWLAWELALLKTPPIVIRPARAGTK